MQRKDWPAITGFPASGHDAGARAQRAQQRAPAPVTDPLAGRCLSGMQVFLAIHKPPVRASGVMAAASWRESLRAEAHSACGEGWETATPHIHKPTAGLSFKAQPAVERRPWRRSPSRVECEYVDSLAVGVKRAERKSGSRAQRGKDQKGPQARAAMSASETLAEPGLATPGPPGKWNYEIIPCRFINRSNS